jgi:hypothetical protein
MDKKAKARKLRDDGYGYAEIAKRIGASQTTVYRWLNPAYAERDRAERREWKADNPKAVKAYNRAYNAENRGVCRECGGDCERHHTLCRGCFDAYRARRWEKIEGLWNAGHSFSEICAEMGMAKGYLSNDMFRMREAGRDLPYRYTMRDGKRVAA